MDTALKTLADEVVEKVGNLTNKQVAEVEGQFLQLVAALERRIAALEKTVKMLQ